MTCYYLYTFIIEFRNSCMYYNHFFSYFLAGVKVDNQKRLVFQTSEASSIMLIVTHQAILVCPSALCIQRMMDVTSKEVHVLLNMGSHALVHHRQAAIIS